MKEKIFAVFLLIVAVAFLNTVLAAALFVLFVLSVLTLVLLQKFRVLNAQVAIIFSVVLFTYLGATLFVHYNNFYPFGGGEGDQREYHQAAVEISNDFRQGNFSLENIDTHLQENHSASSYPVFIAVLYSLTMPDKIVGKMLSVWFVVLSALLLYALSRELGTSNKFAFWVGLSPIAYPSYLYWGSGLLREGIVVLLILLSCLLIVRMQKRFSPALFLLFYTDLAALFHFRFYPGLVVLFVFLFSWFFLFSITVKRKLAYGLFIVPLLGFIPQILGHGYYSVRDILHYTNPKMIVIYRENLPRPRLKEIQEAERIEEIKQAGQEETVQARQEETVQTVQTGQEETVQAEQKETAPIPEQPSTKLGSTVVVEASVDNPKTFVKNYLTSFLYMLLGPFPWHIRYARQLFVLVEMIPWWIAFCFIVKGIVRSRAHWRTMLPIILVSLGIIAEIALLLNAYGTYMRIRMPAFLLLFTLLPFAFQKKETKKETEESTST